VRGSIAILLLCPLHIYAALPDRKIRSKKDLNLFRCPKSKFYSTNTSTWVTLLYMRVALRDEASEGI